MQAILGFEGVAKTQIIKQPDVLMVMYLLPELFDEEAHEANFRFYTPRTDYAFGSSLGPAIQSILAARHGDLHEAYQNFMLAAQADLKDLRGNASDGIHGASAGGLWQAAVFGFGGLQILDDSFSIVPKLPQHWTRLSFNLVWKGELHNFDIKAGENSQ
jgi:kojibiose phosphorylase